MLEKLPPCVIQTGEFDFLRRDALHFIERLKQVGKYLDHVDYPGVDHGFESNLHYEQTDLWYAHLNDILSKYV